jgi:ADP-heptose:LPS heptosyltransferase
MNGNTIPSGASTHTSDAPWRGRKLMDVRRIALLRANGIGDLIFILPAVEALKAAYPEGQITLLARPWHRDFLAGRGLVDEVVVVPSADEVLSGRMDLSEIEPFFEDMRARSFDIALQLYGGGRYSNPFVKRLGAQLTAGLRAFDAEALDRTVPYVYYQNEYQRYLEVVALVGAVPATLQPHLPTLPRDFVEVEALGIGGQSCVALNPGAGDARRRWPVTSFAGLAEELARMGKKVLLVGGAEDVAAAAQIEELCTTRLVNLAGELSLSGLAGLLSRCELVVSNDSGPLHLAVALGTATVGIYWCGNLINAGPAERDAHRPLLSWQTSCPACGAAVNEPRCRHDDSWVAMVSIAEVVQAARELVVAHTGVSADEA